MSALSVSGDGFDPIRALAGRSLPKFRVNGPLSNLPAFQAAFQCKAGAPMVRQGKDRCEVW